MTTGLVGGGVEVDYDDEVERRARDEGAIDVNLDALYDRSLEGYGKRRTETMDLDSGPPGVNQLKGANNNNSGGGQDQWKNVDSNVGRSHGLFSNINVNNVEEYDVDAALDELGGNVFGGVGQQSHNNSHLAGYSVDGDDFTPRAQTEDEQEYDFEKLLREKEGFHSAAAPSVSASSSSCSSSNYDGRSPRPQDVLANSPGDMHHIIMRMRDGEGGPVGSNFEVVNVVVNAEGAHQMILNSPHGHEGSILHGGAGVGV